MVEDCADRNTKLRFGNSPACFIQHHQILRASEATQKLTTFMIEAPFTRLYMRKGNKSDVQDRENKLRPQVHLFRVR